MLGEEGRGPSVSEVGGALSGIKVGQETGSNFYTSFTCRMVEYPAWKLGFVLKI